MKTARTPRLIMPFVVIVFCLTGVLYSQQLAFPTAEGYGKYAVGGRGGKVYEVTTLNPSGPGSLGEAIGASGPRTVVFRVSGTIAGNFGIKNDKITIAGQTAPGDGICIRGNLSVGANDVIIRYIRVRAEGRGDAIGGRYKKDIIIDHVTASWSSDEVMSFYHNENVTVQWCMITEACSDSHRFGGIWGNQYGTYHHNLIAHNDSRNPRWASGCGYNDYRNNVVYNWGYNSCYGAEAHQKGDRRDPKIEHSTINMIANTCKAGPATKEGVRSRIADPSSRDGDADAGKWWVSDNVVVGSPAVTNDNLKGVTKTGSAYRLDSPWPAMPINQRTAEEAYQAVLDHAGCSLPCRDAIDKRIVREVRTGTATMGHNGIISKPSDVGGWPDLKSAPAPADSDHDGMPDTWEDNHGLNKHDPEDRNKMAPDGYTMLERYLNSLIPGSAMKEVKSPARPRRTRPRVIATTDGEIDDLSTMVRFLLYSCDFDVAAIIQNNSRFQKDGHSRDKAKDLIKDKEGPWFPVMIDAYKTLVPQLRKHNPDYPSAEYLMSVMRVGNENRNDLYVEPPRMQTKNTEGEKLIIKILLDDDPRPVHIGCWGGSNTVASALWRLKFTGEYTKEQFEKAAAKVRIYCIWYQDGGGQWIEDNVKEAQIFEAWGWWHTWDYGSGGGRRDTYNPPEVVAYMTSEWFKKNQKNNHGPLASITPQKFISEGDTPAWLNLINNGLEAHVDYTLGGWGGRAIFPYPDTKPNYLTDDPGCEKPGDRPTAKAVTDDGDPKKTNWRWTIAAQNDFAARLDWCIMDFEQANHAPVAKFNGTTVNDSPLVKIDAAPGETLSLDATGSTDPDKDTLSYKWWVYKEAGTYGEAAEIEDSTSQKASMTIPDNAGGKTIHLLLEVTDDGEPPLKGWRRAVISVKRN